MTKERITELEMEEYHHVVILTNGDNPTHQMGIAFSDEHDNILAFVPMTLADANKFGESFCEKYNEMLRKVRGDT